MSYANSGAKTFSESKYYASILFFCAIVSRSTLRLCGEYAGSMQGVFGDFLSENSPVTLCDERGRDLYLV
jgi:hypothetical protein